MRKACVCKRDALNCVRIQLWPLWLDDSSHVLMTQARESIDNPRAGASDSLQSAATRELGHKTYFYRTLTFQMKFHGSSSSWSGRSDMFFRN